MNSNGSIEIESQVYRDPLTVQEAKNNLCTDAIHYMLP